MHPPIRVPFAANHETALSPTLRSFLETLEARHSGLEQAEKAIRTNGCLRRDPIETLVSPQLGS